MTEFLARALPAEKILALDDHLTDCAACRRRLMELSDGERVKAMFRGFTGLRDSRPAEPISINHLTYEQLADYVDGKLAGQASESVHGHLSECQRCMREARELGEFSQLITGAVSQNGANYPAGKAVNPVPVSVGFGWLRRANSSAFRIAGALAVLV